MSVKIHLTGYRTAQLQIYNWLIYTHIIIQKILEKKIYNVILKIRFHGSINYFFIVFFSKALLGTPLVIYRVSQ